MKFYKGLICSFNNIHFQPSGGGGAGSYAREEYAFDQSGSNTGASSNSGNSKAGESNAGSGGGGKPRTDVSCYLGPK